MLRFLIFLVLAAAPTGPARGVEGYRSVVCPPSEQNLRNSEGDIAVLADGSLLLAWSRFEGRDDHATAAIAAKKSRDGGKTWGDEYVLQENIGAQNVMSVSFLRLRSGPLLFFFLVKNADGDLHVYMRKSGDEAKTWTDPKKVTRGPGYHIMNNARAVQLESGRILLPIAHTPDIGKQYQNQVCFLYYSDDDGETWSRSADTVTLDGSPAMEPGAVQRADGSVLMIIRTALDRIYQSISHDGGDTWDEPRPMPLTAPAAPSTVSRVPGSDDLLMVWNNNPLGRAAGWGGRTPLTTAVSDDGGETWKHVMNIENDPGSGYGYTSVTWHEGRALLTYYHWKNTNPNFEKTALVFRSIPREALYGSR